MNWQLNIGSKCNSLILQKVLCIRVHLFSFKYQYDTNYNTIIMVHLLLSRVHACIFRVFTKEQYFDSDGLFFSTVYSTPVLFNCLLLLVRVLSPPVLIYTYSMERFYVGSTFVNFGGVNIAQMYVPISIDMLYKYHGKITILGITFL